MSITPDDWFDRFFGNFPFGKRGRRNYFDDMFGGFDQMRKEIESLRNPLRIWKRRPQKI